MERHGVEVLRPRLLTEAEKAVAGTDGYANFFARDPFFVVGDQVVESSMRFLHRRREVLSVRDLMLERVYPADCGYTVELVPLHDQVSAKDSPHAGYRWSTSASPSPVRWAVPSDAAPNPCYAVPDRIASCWVARVIAT